MQARVSCKKCGQDVQDGARFCSSCGLGISGEEAGSITQLINELAPDVGEYQKEQLRKATLGEYDVIEELGQGGMARVYLAHDISLDRKVAIKVMSAELKRRDDMAQRFVLEAQTAAKLSHPNIIPIYAVRETDDLLYFVMKCIEGSPLDEVIADGGPMPIPSVVEILAQVAGGLEYAHRHGVVHRDVKPANIILDTEGWAIVTDFGIAKVAHTSGLTMTGATIGTPSYMSPEQCSGGDITGLSDQYSLGMVAYEMLAGELPFSSSESIVQIIWSHFNQEPENIGARRPDCPPEVADVVMRMLAKGPGERWESLTDVADALRAASVGMSSQNLADAAQAARRPTTRFRTPHSPIPVQQPKTAPDSVAAIAVAPQTVSLCMGKQCQLTALVSGPTGNSLGDRAVKWESEDNVVASVSATGMLTASGIGTTRIVATAEDTTGSASIVVTPVPVAKLLVNGNPGRLTVGRHVRLKATVLASDGLVLDRQVTWSVSDKSLASIDATGNLVAIKPGEVAVAIECEGKQSATRLTLVPVPVESVELAPTADVLCIGESFELTCVVNGGERVLLDRVIEWRSLDSTVARVVEGKVHAVGAGTTTITACCEGIVDSADIEVVQPRVAAISIRPAIGTIAGSESVRLATTVVSTSGEEMRGATLQWTSSKPKIVQVSSSGVCQGLKVGTAVIRAECDGQSATCRLTVTRVGVSQLRMGGPKTVDAGSSIKLEVTAHDRFGERLPGRVVEWMSSDPLIAQVETDGTVRSLAAGVAEITASSGVARTSVRVRVVEPTIRSLRVEPGDVEIGVGAQAQLRAIAVTAGGALMDVTAEMWRSSNPAVVRVTEDGVIAGLRAGAAKVAVQAVGKRAVTSVYVHARR